MTAAPQPGLRKPSSFVPSFASSFLVDVRDLGSVRRAARALGWAGARRGEAAVRAALSGPGDARATPGGRARPAAAGAQPAGMVILGDDWMAPPADEAALESRRRRGLITLSARRWRARSSPSTWWR